MQQSSSTEVTKDFLSKEKSDEAKKIMAVCINAKTEEILELFLLSLQKTLNFEPQSPFCLLYHNALKEIFAFAIVDGNMITVGYILKKHKGLFNFNTELTLFDKRLNKKLNWPIIYLAIKHGSLEIIKFLVKQGFPLKNLHDSRKITLLDMVACRPIEQQQEIFLYLLQNGYLQCNNLNGRIIIRENMKQDPQNIWASDIAEYAVKFKFADLLKYLLENKVVSKDAINSRVIEFIITNENLDIFRCLCQNYGVKFYFKLENCLMLTEAGEEQIISAKVNLAHLALRVHRQAIVEYLIDHHPSLFVEAVTSNIEEVKSLPLALISFCLENLHKEDEKWKKIFEKLVAVLIKGNFSVQIWANNPHMKRSLLTFAVHAKATDLVRIILQNPDVKVNEKNAYGHTALHEAAALGLKQIVQLLLQHPDIDVNALDNVGRNALSAAALSQNKEVCNLIAQHPEFTINVFNVCESTLGYLLPLNFDIGFNVNEKISLKAITSNRLPEEKREVIKAELGQKGTVTVEEENADKINEVEKELLPQSHTDANMNEKNSLKTITADMPSEEKKSESTTNVPSPSRENSLNQPNKIHTNKSHKKLASASSSPTPFWPQPEKNTRCVKPLPKNWKQVQCHGKIFLYWELEHLLSLGKKGDNDQITSIFNKMQDKDIRFCLPQNQQGIASEWKAAVVTVFVKQNDKQNGPVESSIQWKVKTLGDTGDQRIYLLQLTVTQARELGLPLPKEDIADEALLLFPALYVAKKHENYCLPSKMKLTLDLKNFATAPKPEMASSEQKSDSRKNARNGRAK